MKQKIVLIAVASALGLTLGLANADESSIVNATDAPALVAAADVILPDGSRPDMDQDHSTTVDVEKPEVEHMDVDVETPDIDKPEVEKPDMDKPDMNKPEIEHPDVSHPDVDH